MDMARRGEKKITEFTYENGAVRIKVPVMMIDGRQQRPEMIPGIAPHSNEAAKVGTYFRVKLEDPDIHEEDVDVDKLRSRVFASLKDAVAIEWQDKLYVEFQRPSRLPPARDRKVPAGCEAAVHQHEDDLTVGLKLKWSPVQLAEVGKNRQKVHREFQRIVDPSMRMGKDPCEIVPSGRYVIQWSATRDGWPETGTEKPYRPYLPVSEWRALVPNTEANRNALLTIAEALDRLGDQLSKLLNQPMAEQVLASVAAKGLAGLGDEGLKLLPAPAATREINWNDHETWPRQLVLKHGYLRGENNETLPKCSPRQLRQYGYQQDKTNPQLWFRDPPAAAVTIDESDPFDA